MPKYNITTKVWRENLCSQKQTDMWHKMCPSCDVVEQITYGSAWNIQTGKFKGQCKKCAGKESPNSGQFKKGHASWTLNRSGELHPCWQGGKTSEVNKLRNTKEYKLFRKTVLNRDNHMCTICSNTKSLEVDHIKPRYLYPELQFDINNGRVLCSDCHKKTETYGPKVKRLKRNT